MPSTEFVQTKETLKNAVSYSNYLKVFILYSCPICGCYTIHAPRLNAAGNWYVDHTRVRAYQMDFDGNEYDAGFAPLNSCLVDDNIAIQNIEQTRTVIRVK
jgi:hypothetical protein